MRLTSLSRITVGVGTAETGYRRLTLPLPSIGTIPKEGSLMIGWMSSKYMPDTSTGRLTSNYGFGYRCIPTSYYLQRLES